MSSPASLTEAISAGLLTNSAFAVFFSTHLAVRISLSLASNILLTNFRDNRLLSDDHQGFALLHTWIGHTDRVHTISASEPANFVAESACPRYSRACAKVSRCWPLCTFPDRESDEPTMVPVPFPAISHFCEVRPLRVVDSVQRSVGCFWVSPVSVQGRSPLLPE